MTPPADLIATTDEAPVVKPGAEHVQALIDSGRIHGAVAGAVRGFAAEKKCVGAIPARFFHGLTKRIAGQVSGTLKDAFGMRRSRWDPYKQHCRTCTCGTGDASAR